MERLKQELLACLGEEGLKLHEMMKEHTTFRVGGAADYFIQPKSAEELRAAFEILHRYEMPVLVIGNGSNLLVRDKGIRGAVIQIYNRMAEITIEGNTIHTKGGALLSAVAARAADKGLTGLEFASGIPGSIGGAVVMNAGAYGGEMKATSQKSVDAWQNWQSREGQSSPYSTPVQAAPSSVLRGILQGSWCRMQG